MYYVGVDIGGTGIKVGIVTDGGEIIAKGAISTSVKDGYEVIVKEMAKLIEDTVSDAKITPDDVASIGIGCPGSIDDKKGEVIYSNNLEFKNVPLCAELKKFIREVKDDCTVRIIAKIESEGGVENISEIIDESDGVMIARGDMGVEIELERLPEIQKRIIKKCLGKGKISITATQMLETMITNPRPTRAEVTDIANAIYDGTSAIMLSGETAAGKYPAESVATMARIAQTTEDAINYKKRFLNTVFNRTSVTDAISHATLATAMDLNAGAIVAVTRSGHTAYSVSGSRPYCKVIGSLRSPGELSRSSPISAVRAMCF